ncbi:MAG: cobalamin-binding protein [Acidobacteria bacterium]|nr:MAG: cobalamin-binding protein [Acidobacteriota bacterium]
MSSDLLAQITASLVAGDPDATVEGTRQALAAGLEPLAIIEDGLVPGMRIVGDKYSTGEYFLPNLIVSASGMKQAMAVLEPELKARRQQVKSAGGVVIGTVRGDIHEIGKSLVATMLAANGFEVHDLGVDVPIEQFVETVRRTGAGLVGLSALLTTTMNGQRAVIQALEQAGLRDRVKVMVGGAPVTQKYASEIGADGWAQDAVAAVNLATRLVAQGAGA